VPAHLLYNETLSVVGPSGPLYHSIITGTNDITWVFSSYIYTLTAGSDIQITYRMSADCSAISGQNVAMTVTSSYDEVGYDNTRNSDAITVQRGNLVIQKLPSNQLATVGDVVTWTVTARNSGLGYLYGVEITDTMGAGLINQQGLTTATIAALAPGASQQYVVTATVNSCTNLTNTVAAAWTCGNQDGAGTPANPVTALSDITLIRNVPDISFNIPPIDIPYCASSYPLTWTITNNGAGAAYHFTFSTELVNSNLECGISGAGWQKASVGQGMVFTYTANGGVIQPGETVTLSLVVTDSVACSQPARTGVCWFQPAYTDQCDVPFSPPLTAGVWSIGADRPTFELWKRSIGGAYVSDLVTYVVTMTLSHLEYLTGAVSITDVVPAGFNIEDVQVNAGATARAGQQITWTVAPTQALGAQLTITARPPDDPCLGGEEVTNYVTGTVPTTCGCTLDRTAYAMTPMQRSYDAAVSKTASALEVETCTDVWITNTYGITNSVGTWAGAVFTESLSSGLLYNSGSLSVTLDGVDVTGLITMAQTSPLVLQLDRLNSTGHLTGVLNIRYQAHAPAGSEDYFYDWSQ
jgi:uncharacterized repeat protein (TIGR01451 family)